MLVLAIGTTLLAGSSLARVPTTSEDAASDRRFLPNGRAITPAGTMVTADDFPGGLVLAKDGPLFVVGAGEARNRLGAVDPVTLRGTYVYPISPAASGQTDPASLSGHVALSPDRETLYVAGAGRGDVMSFSASDPPVPGPTYPLPNTPYAGGVAASPDGADLFVTEPLNMTKPPYHRGTKLTRISLRGQPPKHIDVGVHPLPVASAKVPRVGPVVAVGNVGEETVSIVNPKTMRVVTKVHVGRHPSSLVFTPDGSALLVVSSLDDRLDEISTRNWRKTSTLSLSSPVGIGAQPNGIAVSPNARHVYVTLAQDNAVAVVRRRDSRLRLEGRIPTAWWPTAVAYDSADPALIVSTGKGLGFDPFIPPGLPAAEVDFVAGQRESGRGTNGVLQRIPLPNAAQLAKYSKQVERNNRWSAPAPAAKVCGPPQIKHVVLIVRENKTWDQELSDTKAGGDLSRLMWGRPVTPNTHAIVERFGMLTAFYVNEEISDTGHAALTGSLVSEWDERFMLQYYAGHSPVEYAEYAADAEGEGFNVDEIQLGPSDYLIDNVWRHGLDFKIFGHAFRHSQTDPRKAAESDFESHIMRDMPGFGWNTSVPDTERAKFWVKEFKKDVAAGTFPAFEIIYLPMDHTSSFAGGKTPTEEIADNDVATGMIVEALSHSKYWRNSAVFMEEDDAQSGSDHVDSHRSVAFVASPWTKRGHISKVHHDQLSVLRTIEMMLGLPPLTEMDATATPIYEIWSKTPDLRPYKVIEPSIPTGPIADAANAAARRYARQLTTRNPQWRGLDAMPPHHQLDIQWMATHGGDHFNPTLFGAPIGPVAAGEDLTRVGPAPPSMCARHR